MSFMNGECPGHFKLAEVIHIHKADDEDNPGNYRPVSFISNLAKLFETLLHKRIINFLDKFKLP